jgi:hypothetical protein
MDAEKQTRNGGGGHQFPALALDYRLHATVLANLMVQDVEVKLLARNDGIPGHPTCVQRSKKEQKRIPHI